MHRILLSFALMSALLAGCGEDPPPLFADIRWQVQCSCYGMCSGIPDRDVNNIDGEDGNSISCSVRERSGQSVLTFNVSKGSDYTFEIRDAAFPPGGGPVGGASCTVRIDESGNSYVGACGSSQPSELQPCQIRNLEIGEDMDGFPQISGELVCLELQSTVDSMVRREVTAPRGRIDNSGGMCRLFPDTEPVAFRIVNCKGL